MHVVATNSRNSQSQLTRNNIAIQLTCSLSDCKEVTSQTSNEKTRSAMLILTSSKPGTDEEPIYLASYLACTTLRGMLHTCYLPFLVKQSSASQLNLTSAGPNSMPMMYSGHFAATQSAGLACPTVSSQYQSIGRPVRYATP